MNNPKYLSTINYNDIYSLTYLELTFFPFDFNYTDLCSMTYAFFSMLNFDQISIYHLGISYFFKQLSKFTQTIKALKRELKIRARNTMDIQDLVPKTAAEIVPYQFDFSLLIAPEDQIADINFSVVYQRGVPDSNPDLADMIAGAYTVYLGNVIKQQISGGVSGAIYLIICEVTTASGDVYQLGGLLSVT